MGDDNDFTFCQVGSTIDQDGLESQKTTPNNSGVALKDEVSTGDRGNPKGIFLWKDESLDDAISRNVGSLSFSVTDTSSAKDSNKLLKQKEASDAGDSTGDSLRQKVAIKKPAARAKVPFEKGHSQMDWLKLTRTHPDLAGLKGQSNRRLISMEEVKQHQSEGSMWTVLKGRVYNISPYMKFHPGGVDMLMKAVGKDCTSLFNKYHAWVNAEFLLEKCLVGSLEAS